MPDRANEPISARFSGPSGDAPDASHFQFRDLIVVPGHRALMRDGAAVEIGSRAFDLLHVLIRAKGRVVTKREIFDFVWPAITVDESNLRFQIACLRRALGKDRDVVKTVQGRGYMFAVGPEAADIAGLQEPALPAQESWGVRPARHEPAKIAVIEDDENTREALDGLLRSSGLSPLCFASSEAFWSSDAWRSAHCLVMDVCLPDCSGLDLHADLQDVGIKMPVIFISGYADVPMSVRAMKAGAVEFLTKPVRHEELLRAVNSAVEGRLI